jgi:hypothetical protein
MFMSRLVLLVTSHDSLRYPAARAQPGVLRGRGVCGDQNQGTAKRATRSQGAQRVSASKRKAPRAAASAWDGVHASARLRAGRTPQHCSYCTAGCSDALA